MRNYPSEEPAAKKDKNYLKSFNKIVNEGSEQIVEQCSVKCEVSAEFKTECSNLYDDLMFELIARARAKHETII